MDGELNMNEVHFFASNEKPIVVSVFANNSSEEQLELSLEEKLLAKHLQDCQFVKYHCLSNATVDEVIDTLSEYKNKVGVFHFGGHATETHLFLEDVQAKATGFVRLFKEHGSLPLVYLNGCSTKGQVNLLLGVGVAAIIATEVEIEDDVAIRFADRFYRSLSQGHSIKKAFDDAKTDSEIRDFTENIELHIGDYNILDVGLLELSNYINRTRLLVPYALWLQQQHSYINIGGIEGANEIELDQIFVSLKGDISKSFEIFQTQKQLEEALEELEQLWANQELTHLEKQKQKSKVLGRTAIMPSIEERDVRLKKRGGADKNLTLSDAFAKYDKLVILGDPGTGKTTLARWLTLIFSTAILNGENEVWIQERSLIDGMFSTIGLGGTRLPILVRVGEFAEEKKIKKDLSILDYLKNYAWNKNQPSFSEKEKTLAGQKLDPHLLYRLMIDYIRNGKALFIFDGLDEISDELNRKDIVRDVEDFVNNVLDGPNTTSLDNHNKLIVTSRIAGYHLQPINHEDLYHVTIQHMNNSAVRYFCETWLRAVHLKAKHGRKLLQIEYESWELSKKLEKLIFDSSRPGIQDLAGNPLLLTQLCKIYYLDGQNLPETRIELYEKSIDKLLSIWETRFKSTADDFNVYKMKVFLILEDIAEYIHENYPAGLILRGEVENLTKNSLKRFYQENPHIVRLQSLDIEGERFLKTISEEVGVLAARGEDLYGFLHLTFEEYFAAKKLLREQSQISERIISKAYQPRWREPLLLAISSLNNAVPIKQDRNKVLRDLLDAQDTMGNIVPRSANLIAMAVPEMRYRLETEFIKEVILKLLEAYTRTEALEDGKILRDNVEETFSSLAKNEEIWRIVIDVFVMILRSDLYDDHIKNGVSFLIKQKSWKHILLPEVFIDARKYDLESWKWPIHQNLQNLANTQPETLDHPDLILRSYLKKYPEAMQFIRGNSSWKKIVLLIYGGLTEASKENKVSVYFSPDGIYEESFLTDKIIDLLEMKAEASSLAEYCSDVLKNSTQPIQNQVDCMLVLLALDGGTLFGIRAFLGENSDLRNALVRRLTRLLASFHGLINIVIGDINNEVVKNLFSGKEQEYVYLILLQIFQVSLVYGETTPNPITWIEALPKSFQPKMLAEFWAKIFLNKDDAVYNLAVSLDTVGGQLEKMGAEQIAESIARITETLVLPPFEKWHIERIPYEPQNQYDIIEEALQNLSLISSDFDLLKFWVLKQIFPLLNQYPHLKSKGVSEVLLSMKSKYYFEEILKLFSDKNSDLFDVIEPEVESALEKRKIVYLFSPRFIKYIVNDSFFNEFEDSHLDRPDKKLKLILEALSYFGKNNYQIHRSPEDSQVLFDKLLLKAKDALKQIDSPEQKVKGYLKLAVLSPESMRKGFIKTALEKLDAIEDSYVLAQSLREIKPWTHNDEELSLSFAQKYLEIQSIHHKSVLENFLYPLFLDYVKLDSNSDTFEVLSVGALIRDINQVFALPSDVAGLWSWILNPNSDRIENAVYELYVRGRSQRHRLTTIATLAISRLIQIGRRDLVLVLAISVERPVSEAIALISDWMDDESPTIRAFASVLLLEAGILNAHTFSGIYLTLFENVFEQQDQFRYRIYFAINSHFFYASMIGIDGLELIHRAILDNADRYPYLVKGLAFLYERTIFDAPEIISYFIEIALKGGRKSHLALDILRNIQMVKGQETIKIYTNGINYEVPVIQKSFLRSVVYVLSKWETSLSLLERHDYREDIRGALRIAIHSSDVDIRKFVLDAMGYLPSLTEEDILILKEFVQNGSPSDKQLAIVSLGRKSFEVEEEYIMSLCRSEDQALRASAYEVVTRHLIWKHHASLETLLKIEEVLSFNQASELLDVLLRAAFERWWNLYSKNCYKMFGFYFEKYGHEYENYVENIIPVLSEKRYDGLEYDYEQSVNWVERMVHLDALAAGAERLPATFSRKARQSSDYDAKLQQIVHRSKIFTDRMNAITCLGYMRRMGQSCIDAFCVALKDISQVQDAAINSTHRFWETDSMFIQTLSRQMDNETLSAKYAVLKILTSIGTYHKTDPSIRQEIIDVLVSKMNHKEYYGDVYVFRNKITYFQKEDGTEVSTESGENVEYIGLLKNELYRSVLEIAGVMKKIE